MDSTRAPCEEERGSSAVELAALSKEDDISIDISSNGLEQGENGSIKLSPPVTSVLPDVTGEETAKKPTEATKRAKDGTKDRSAGWKRKYGLNESNRAIGRGAKTGKFWTDEEMVHLLRLGRDQEYRSEVTGEGKLDWGTIGKSLGRGARAAKRKFDNLDDVDVVQTASGYGLRRPPNDGKKWTDEEVLELLNYGDPNNVEFRYVKQGRTEVDWGKIARKFGRSRDTVSYKFSYEEKNRAKLAAGEGNTACKNRKSNKICSSGEDRLNSDISEESNTGVEHTVDEDRKLVEEPRVGRQATDGQKANKANTCHNMAVIAFRKISPLTLEATSSQIFDFIEKDETCAPQLDWSIQPGKKSVPRWKHNIRCVFYAYPYFIKTDRKLEGEHVYRLDVEKMKEAERKAEEKARIAAANRKAREESRAKVKDEKAAKVEKTKANVAMRKAKIKRKIATAGEKEVAQKKAQEKMAQEKMAQEKKAQEGKGAANGMPANHNEVPPPSNVSDENGPVITVPGNLEGALDPNFRAEILERLLTWARENPDRPIDLQAFMELGLSWEEIQQTASTLSSMQMQHLRHQLEEHHAHANYQYQQAQFHQQQMVEAMHGGSGFGHAGFAPFHPDQGLHYDGLQHHTMLPVNMDVAMQQIQQLHHQAPYYTEDGGGRAP